VICGHPKLLELTCNATAPYDVNNDVPIDGESEREGAGGSGGAGRRGPACAGGAAQPSVRVVGEASRFGAWALLRLVWVSDAELGGGGAGADGGGCAATKPSCPG
jgi:hypothetical protein